eukprot:996339-Rhodomonas_salina.1
MDCCDVPVMMQVSSFLTCQRWEAPGSFGVDHHDHSAIRQGNGAAILLIPMSSPLEVHLAQCPEKVVQGHYLGRGVGVVDPTALRF